MTKLIIPKNTEKSSKWAMTNFKDWFDDFNSRNPIDSCPYEVLTPKCPKDVLNKWLCVFINETRSKTGDKYPPKTIQSILAGILRFMRVSTPDYPNFFNKEDPDFNSFQVTLDNLFKHLRCDGVGSSSSRTETISCDEETQLWTSGVLNVDCPKSLLRCAFYYNGKCFCLRGGQEHRDLGVSQLERLYEPDRYVYREKSSKNRPGGINQTRLDHKCVTIVANPNAGDHCHVFILDKYIQKLPKDAVEKDLFYCKPLLATPNDEKSPWYYAVPIGKNMLGNMVKEICSEAGLDGKKTNHSLRVAGATSLYQAGVPEKLIQQRTGHRCLQSLRDYERVSSDQEIAVSRILSGEVNSYERKLDNKPLPLGEKQDRDLSAQNSYPGPGIQYNNCTVNVYGSPANSVPPGMPGIAPPSAYIPPYPPPFYPPYPEFLPMTSYPIDEQYNQ